MKIIQYRSGYKYQLAADYSMQIDIKGFSILTEFISLSLEGVLFMRSGYASDGPSGLTFDTKSSMRGSFVHDALYQLLRQGLIPAKYRKYIDQLLRDICIEDGMWKWRAKAWYRAVRGFAGFAASTDNRKRVLTAP